MAERKINIKDRLKDNTMLLALVAVIIFFQILIVTSGRGSLLKPANVTNIISQNAYVLVLATGMLLCIISGGNIDLSVGSLVCLIGAIAGKLIVDAHMNTGAAIILCLLFGIALGAWQAFWIAYIRISSFIVTLSGMLLFRGIANIILNGLTISPFPDNYMNVFASYFPQGTSADSVFLFSMLLGIIACAVYVFSKIHSTNNKKRKGYEYEAGLPQLIRLIVVCALILWFASLLGRYKGLPVILIWLLVIISIYSYFTAKTVPGRHFYAMGGNAKATELSGIDTNKILFFAYVNMGFLSAIAALICCARFNSASPSAGTGYEMDAIAACFVGGAGVFGGSGTVLGTVIGALFIGILNNGMSIMGVDANWQKAVKGLVLLLAVVFDVLSKKRASK
ncbi:MAG: sugar ABC transporter permease [Spirochaetia bacterium]|jgi:putative multiple sugar transport system permease protein|nr:sugar ABC transporter permease [Spirochaetia bacterium]